MARIRGKDTMPERAVRSLLHGLGLRFRLHRKALPGAPDIVLPKYHTVVFVHGCFWHCHRCQKGRIPHNNRRYWRRKLSRNVERDHQHRKALGSLGWRVLVVWECELRRPERVRQRLHRHFFREH